MGSGLHEWYVSGPGTYRDAIKGMAYVLVISKADK